MRVATFILVAALAAAPALTAPSSDTAKDAAKDTAKDAARYIQTSPLQRTNEVRENYEIEEDEPQTPQAQQAEQGGAEVAVTPQQTQGPIGLTNIVGSVWELVVSWIRRLLGVSRREPPRVARALLGAAAGDEGCWKTTACQAGRMLRGLRDPDYIYKTMQSLLPKRWQGAVRRMRKATLENEDCRVYKCGA